MSFRHPIHREEMFSVLDVECGAFPTHSKSVWDSCVYHVRVGCQNVLSI